MIEQLSETENLGEKLHHRNQRLITDLEAACQKLEKNLARLKKLKGDGEWGKPSMDWNGRVGFVQHELENEILPDLERMKLMARELMQDVR